MDFGRESKHLGNWKTCEVGSNDSTVLNEDQAAAVALNTVPGLGPARLRALLVHFKSMKCVLGAQESDLRRVPGIGGKLAREIRALDAGQEVDRQLRIAHRVSAQLVMKTDTEYPPLLREIHDPPAFLWRRGHRSLDLKYCVAIVGSRRATRYGVDAAFAMARDLSACGYTVVSGMAYGIDAAAHRGALAGGSPTVAVFGCGVDCVYPGAHRKLAREVLRTGWVLSEFALGSKPDATNFPRRNRLISGMSLGVVVVEAYEQGGGLITAHFALEQNREVFSIPGPVSSKSSIGTNRLIRDGAAKLVMDAHDVLVELPRPPNTPDHAHVSERTSTGLTAEERKLIDVIDVSGADLDTISYRSGRPSSHALRDLLNLEIKGLVTRGVDGLFYLSHR